MNAIVGRLVRAKFRRNARQAGMYQTARMLRRYGFGLGAARMILLGRL